MITLALNVLAFIFLGFVALAMIGILAKLWEIISEA